MLCPGRLQPLRKTGFKQQPEDQVFHLVQGPDLKGKEILEE